ncbi:hypothetical protein [Burkholderia multivorans]|uniref:hypothetical protein n=1 Tax=Burkholderia multivorans TaxID=87883 RepID=UPI002184E0B1|nr:hypothetical protein [Burkholderia multivorans]UQP90419.1 hypothetical protein L0Y91_27225 [Burkholderia multivorans]
MINRKLLCAAPLSAALLAACGGDDSVTSAPTHLSAATPAAMTQTCDALAAKLAYANTSFTSVTTAAAGALTVAGKPVPEHCVIAGKMNERVSAVDGTHLCDRLRDAAAEGLERPFLLSGERRTRR